MNLHPKREDMITATYYTICLVILVFVMFYMNYTESGDQFKNPLDVVLYIMLITVLMYSSGIFFGIVIARLSRQTEDEEKNKKLQESNTNKQGLTEPLCETGYQRV